MMAGDPRKDSYDVVVIGAGIGGLSAAAALAREGKRVVVIDQAEAPGGYAHAFVRGPYTFDPAVHVMPEGKDGQFPDVYFRYLGVRDRIEWIPHRSFYAAHYPNGFFLQTPLGLDEYIAAHAERFPQEKQHFDTLFRLMAQVHLEAHQLPPRLSLAALDEAAALFPTLFKYQKATLGEVIDDHVTDPRARAVCGSMWPYLGEPPSRVSLLTTAQVFHTYVNGCYYPKGGFQSMVDTLVAAVALHGGEIVPGRRVARILLDGGRAKGVALEDGRELRAAVVISNADARQTFTKLVGEEHLPTPFARRLQRMEPAMPAFVVFGATKLDLHQADIGHETFLHLHWDHDQTLRDIRNGKPGGMWMTVPSLADATLAPPGEHAVIMTAITQWDIGVPWARERERWTDLVVNAFDAVVPGLRESLTVIDSATPETLHRYTLNDRGAMYGWANTPNQAASRRLNHATPIEGLYLSGHWTQPGAGSLRTLVSGFHTALMILAGAGEKLPVLQAEGDVAPAF